MAQTVDVEQTSWLPITTMVSQNETIVKQVVTVLFERPQSMFLWRDCTLRRSFGIEWHHGLADVGLQSITTTFYEQHFCQFSFAKNIKKNKNCKHREVSYELIWNQTVPQIWTSWLLWFSFHYVKKILASKVVKSDSKIIPNQLTNSIYFRLLFLPSSPYPPSFSSIFLS